MIGAIDGLLRAEGHFEVGRGRVPVARLLALLVACGFLYGLALGSFGLRAEQALYSGLKVPILLCFSTLVCLPSFFVLNTLLGLRDDLAASLRGVFAAQATVAVTLFSLFPIVLFLYASSRNYRLAILVNGLFFALATLAGQRTLNRHYRPLVRKNVRHQVGRLFWVVLYVFVAIQLAWVLRPFVGAPSMEPSFLRAEAWSNAYVVILRDVLGYGR